MYTNEAIFFKILSHNMFCSKIAKIDKPIYHFFKLGIEMSEYYTVIKNLKQTFKNIPKFDLFFYNLLYNTKPLSSKTELRIAIKIQF